MSETRLYLCSNCGRFLFRIRGPLAALKLDLNCPDRRCKFAQTKDLSRPQEVSEGDRRRWSHLRGTWRLRGNGTAQQSVA